jgi:hypothetical protein
MISETKLEDMLAEAVENGMSYQDYRNLVSELLAEGKSTGHTQNEDMLNYSKLSERRMKRWDKTFKMSAEDKAFFNNWHKPLTFLTVAEGWCGDAAHALPIINKIVETSPNLDLKIVLRDDNDELISNFLTNGAKSIPKLIALDEDFNVLFTWGARPKEATALVEDYKSTHGQLTPEFKEELQKWYNKDKGQATVQDLRYLLSSL